MPVLRGDRIGAEELGPNRASRSLARVFSLSSVVVTLVSLANVLRTG